MQEQKAQTVKLGSYAHAARARELKTFDIPVLPQITSWGSTAARGATVSFLEAGRATVGFRAARLLMVACILNLMMLVGR